MWIDSFIQADWAFSFAMSIILSVIKGAVLFLLLFVLEKSLFRHSANAKYKLYILGLILLAVIFVRDIFIFGLAKESASILNIDPLENMISGLTNFALTVPESNPQVFQLISIAWTIGILFYGLKFSINNRFLSQLRKSSITLGAKWHEMVDQLQQRIGSNQSINIVGSNKIDVTIVMGILKPIIVIPFPLLGHFTPKELETIILHELIHIKRADFLIKHIQSIILCFMYFNPFLYIN